MNNGNRSDSFFGKLGRAIANGWDSFWLFIHRCHEGITRFLKFVFKWIFKKGVVARALKFIYTWVIKKGLWTAIKFIFKYILGSIYMGIKYFFKYTIVLLIIGITKKVSRNKESIDFYQRKSERISKVLAILSLIIIGVVFYDFIFDYTIGYFFRFGFWLFSKMDNNIGKILRNYNLLLWDGTKITIILSVLGTLIGFIIALLMGLLVTQKADKRNRYGTQYLKKFGKFLTKIYVTVIRSTPMMVQGVIIYYGFLLPVLGMSASESIYPAVIVVSINTAAYLTEVIRGGIESIDKGQTEGARSLGLSSWQTMTSIIFPQAIKNSMPAIGNELIINIKDTSVLSVIMVADLFYICQQIYANNVNWLTYVIAAAIYLVLTLLFGVILKKVAKKLDVKPRNLPSAN